jgi:hypothetical protein
VIVTKNTHKLFHKSLSKAYHAKSVPPIFPTRPYRFSPQTDPSQTLSFRYNRFCIGATEFRLPTFCCPFSSIRNFRVVWIGATEFCNLTVGHLIGTAEIYISVSPRFESCYLLSNSVPPSFTLRCHRVGHYRCNGWIFWRCLYIPLHHHPLTREALRTIPYLPHPIF